jgi:hypothetical protein
VCTGDVGNAKARVAGAELSERRCRETEIEGKGESFEGLLGICEDEESSLSLRVGGLGDRDDSWCA